MTFNPQPKQPSFKSKKITSSARGETCSLRLPMVCQHDPSTTVFAHAPSVAHGTAYKSPDWWGMYACSNCHDVIDGRNTNSGLSNAYITMSMIPAIFETQQKLINKGLIEVKK